MRLGIALRFLLKMAREIHLFSEYAHDANMLWRDSIKDDVSIDMKLPISFADMVAGATDMGIFDN